MAAIKYNRLILNYLSEIEELSGRPHNVIPFRPGNFINQRPNCEVWNRLYCSRRRRSPVRGAIVGYDDFDLRVRFLEFPVWMGEFLTSVAGVEYKNRLPFLNTIVFAEILKRLDDRRSGGLLVE